MGITYQLMLYDDFDWGYHGTTKNERLTEFSKEFGGCCELLAQWSHFAVFDIDKQSLYSKERKAVVKKYSDAAWFNMDISMWNWEKIE